MDCQVYVEGSREAGKEASDSLAGNGGDPNQGRVLGAGGRDGTQVTQRQDARTRCLARWGWSADPPCFYLSNIAKNTGTSNLAHRY